MNLRQAHKAEPLVPSRQNSHQPRYRDTWESVRESTPRQGVTHLALPVFFFCPTASNKQHEKATKA